MEEYLLHRTVDGDRWDLLALRYYGEGSAYGLLLQANPEVPFTPLIPPGLSLRIPILEGAALNPAPVPSDSEVYPWL
ncbi:MAG: tail protein X [Acidobacteria bacterium]|nr:tail protein X [Acidobacteriota bacterium]